MAQIDPLRFGSSAAIRQEFIVLKKQLVFGSVYKKWIFAPWTSPAFASLNVAQIINTKCSIYFTHVVEYVS